MPEQLEVAETGAVPATASTAPRVLLLNLNYKVSDKVLGYVTQLRRAGVEVDLVVPELRAVEEVELEPGVRVHPLLSDEREIPLRRAERLLAYRLPGAVIGFVRRVAVRGPLARPAEPVVSVLERGHRRAAGIFHGRVFVPFYRQVRPWLLARNGRRAVARLDVAGADRIVAADHSAVPLGWRLARRYPRVTATTALTTAPYTGEETSGS